MEENDVRKIFIIQEGRTSGKDIIAEMKKRGGDDFYNNTADDIGVYYIDIDHNDMISWKEMKDVGVLMSKGYRRVYVSEIGPIKAKNVKFPYIVASPDTRMDAIKELRNRGFLNLLPLNGESSEGLIYYVFEDFVIRCKGIGDLKKFEADSRFERVRLYDCNKMQQSLNDPRVIIEGDEMTIDFKDAIPKGYECLDEEGNPITEVSFELVRKRFRPKIGSKWYYASDDDFQYFTGSSIWKGDDSDKFFYAKGNCFKTEEEARQLAEALKKAFDETIKRLHNE